MTYSRFCAWTFALALALVFGKAQAQSASTAVPQPYALQATTPEGGKFDMGQRKGKVVMRHEGRIAPEAWDSVAELLP